MPIQYWAVYLFFGFLVGQIARMYLTRFQVHGAFWTQLVGAVGALVAVAIGRAANLFYPDRLWIGFLLAIGGSVAFIAAWRAFRHAQRRPKYAG